VNSATALARYRAPEGAGIAADEGFRTLFSSASGRPRDRGRETFGLCDEDVVGGDGFRDLDDGPVKGGRSGGYAASVP
jgi:hypothetical protein